MTQTDEDWRWSWKITLVNLLNSHLEMSVALHYYNQQMELNGAENSTIIRRKLPGIS